MTDEACQMTDEQIRRIGESDLEGSDLTDLTRFFAMFADPTRARILWALDSVEEGGVCVCALSRALGISVSAISHQLRVLKDMKLISGRREGKHIYYSLCDHHVRMVLEMALEHVKEE